MKLKHLLSSQLLLLFLLSVITQCSAGIYTVSETLKDGGIFAMKEGIFSPGDAPVKVSPGDGRSFISINASAMVTNSSSFGRIQVLVLHSDHLNNIRSQYNDSGYYFCCISPTDYCTPGDAFLNTTTGPELHVFTFDFGNDSLTSQMSETVNVEKSGVWYVFVVSCKALPEVEFQGTVVFMNPYGYLPAELYPFLPFYGVMALIYIVLGIVWLGFCLRHRRVILPLQIWIGVVIGLAIIESATLYFDDLGYNNSGQNYVAAMIVGVLVSTVKRTVSRVLVLVVSLGYGVVRPALGKTKYYIYLLAAMYLIFSGALSIIELLNKAAYQTSLWMFIFLILPVAFLDTAFYWWIFMSLIRTIHELGVRKQTVKMRMYTYFLRTLVCFGVATAIFMILQVIITSKNIDDQWRSYWVWTAGWQWLYFMILVAIVVLWRPTANNTRYGYSETGGDPDDEVILHTFGEVATRSTTLDVPNEITLDPNASFSIDEDDLEELNGPGKME